jgi:serine/threonine protein kinase
MVALKILPADLAEDPQRKRRFFQEARAASALNHPNIVTLHDVGFDGGADYLVMEYVQGKTLDKLIPNAGLNVKEALGWAIQIADAFVNAHAAGIAHRDLKPGNIMINEAGLAKVLDFGLAKVERTPDQPGMTQTLPGVVVGTLGYMSPEQAQGEVEDTRSDIFSFGVLLYEMLSGRRPFESKDRVSTLSAIVNQEPPILIGVPHNLERLIHRCLAKDPAQRYQRMVDVKAALEELIEAFDSGRMASA